MSKFIPLNDNLESQIQTIFNNKFEPLKENLTGDNTLADYFTFVNGYAFSSEDYLTNGKYKIITIKNVNDGYIDTNSVNFINNISNKIEKSAKLNLNDIVISLTGNVGRTAIITEDNLLLNQRVAKIKPKNNLYYGFLYSLFRHPRTKLFLEGISKGTAQANLSPVEVLRLKVNYDQNEVIVYSKTIKPIIKSIIYNNLELKKSKTLLNTLITFLSH